MTSRGSSQRAPDEHPTGPRCLNPTAGSSIWTPIGSHTSWWVDTGPHFTALNARPTTSTWFRPGTLRTSPVSATPSAPLTESPQPGHAQKATQSRPKCSSNVRSPPGKPALAESTSWSASRTQMGCQSATKPFNKGRSRCDRLGLTSTSRLPTSATSSFPRSSPVARRTHRLSPSFDELLAKHLTPADQIDDRGVGQDPGCSRSGRAVGVSKESPELLARACRKVDPFGAGDGCRARPGEPAGRA